MRAILGAITALILVLVLLLVTGPKVAPDRSEAPQAQARQPDTTQPVQPAAPQAAAQEPAAPDDTGNVRDIAGARIELPETWSEFTPEELQASEQLATFAAFLKNAPSSLILADTKIVSDLSGFLIAVDLGRSPITPLEAVTKIEERQRELGRAQVEWAPRSEQVGTFGGASYAIKFPMRGTIGTRMMRGVYYVVQTDDGSLFGGPRGVMIVTLTQQGTYAATDVETMLASMRPG